jgi:aspartate aminotransferase
MPAKIISNQSAAVIQAMSGFLRFYTNAKIWEKAADPNVANFMVGDPHEPPLPGFVEALQKWVVPQSTDWFAYKMNEPKSVRTVAASLTAQLGTPFAPEDIAMTNGAFAGLAVALRSVVDVGDEVIINSPPWFFYGALIAGAGASCVRVPIDPQTFNLDLAAIDAAITTRTRAIIVNSPHNPTGRIYQPDTLAALADLLTAASRRIGQPIYLISDESYRRVVFDGRAFYSPANYYPNTFIVYTYGKQLLTPGERLGYVAMPSTMPERETLRNALIASQVSCGYVLPNATLQHAIEDLEKLSIDIVALQRRRDRLVGELRGLGYEATLPEGTFYIVVKSPLPDDWAFIDLLAEHNVLCLPGSATELPGYFRISLTASDAMVERGLAGFAAAIQAAKELNAQAQA